LLAAPGRVRRRLDDDDVDAFLQTGLAEAPAGVIREAAIAATAARIPGPLRHVAGLAAHVLDPGLDARAHRADALFAHGAVAQLAHRVAEVRGAVVAAVEPAHAFGTHTETRHRAAGRGVGHGARDHEPVLQRHVHRLARLRVDVVLAEGQVAVLAHR